MHLPTPDPSQAFFRSLRAAPGMPGKVSLRWRQRGRKMRKMIANPTWAGYRISIQGFAPAGFFMPRNVCHTWIFRWTRAVLVVAGVSILAEGRAQAGCGDHTFFSFSAFTQNEGSRTPQTARVHTSVNREGALPCGRC